jgi:hypothetical protein
MRECCPPGEGCNNPFGGEPCSLTRLKRSETPEARRALSLWLRYERARGVLGHRRRILRRAYGRVRDRALPPWTPSNPVG